MWGHSSRWRHQLVPPSEPHLQPETPDPAVHTEAGAQARARMEADVRGGFGLDIKQQIRGDEPGVSDSAP